MTKRILSILFILLFKIAYSQDTLVSFKELTFQSNFEKSILTEHFVNGKTNLFDLFMANGSLLREDKLEKDKARFYNHLDIFRNDIKFGSKKNDKKIQILYDDIHKTFLQKYELENKFEDIFYNGNYNCVSASALYALAFKETQIPFVLKEEPTHVYLIAYPNGEKIIIETTTPQGGYKSINGPFKEAFVKMLKDQKLINTQEFTTQSVSSLFDKFYFKNNEEISTLNLVGIQYMNDGLYKFDEKKYEQAYNQFQKAYLFYPSERVAYLMLMSCSFALDQRKEKDSKHAQYLAKLSHFKKYGITDDMVKGEFAQVVQYALFETGNKEQLDQYYHTLDSLLTEPKLKEEITFYYNYENGRLLYNQAHYTKALPFFEKALALKPNNLEVNNIFIGSIIQTRSNRGADKGFIKTLENYSSKYSSLQDNNIFNNILANCYLAQMGTDYTFEDIASGEKYKVQFENQMKNHTDINFDSDLLGKAYSKAAVYYFKKGQASKAKGILAQGLLYSPNNYELQVRQRMIK